MQRHTELLPGVVGVSTAKRTQLHATFSPAYDTTQEQSVRFEKHRRSHATSGSANAKARGFLVNCQAATPLMTSKEEARAKPRPDSILVQNRRFAALPKHCRLEKKVVREDGDSLPLLIA